MVLFIATLVLPSLLGSIAFVFYREKVTNLELLLLFGASVVSFGIMHLAMKEYNMSDTRYFSHKVVSLRYYEPWNEYIHKTCSRTTCTGSGKTRVCHTTYYDCSYVKYHSEYWAKVTETGSEYTIHVSEYEAIKKLWGGDRRFVDMKRNYHTKDGDMYRTDWKGTINTAEIVTLSESYENRTLTANTLFSHQPFEPEEAKKRGLYEYPKNYGKDQLCILGAKGLADSTKRYYNHLNTYSKNYRLYVLYFTDKPRSVAFDQKRHWQGGNDNELVVCIGVNGGGKVTWVEPFSWSKKPLIESHLKSWYSTKGSLDLDEIYPHLRQWLSRDWVKRDFKDFDYIDVELSYAQIVWLWVILSLVNIGLTIFIINNEFNRHDPSRNKVALRWSDLLGSDKNLK